MRQQAAVLKVSRLRHALLTGEARQLREAAGLSYREAARGAGIDAATVFRWEAGERTPRGVAAVRYREFLDAVEDEVRGRTAAAQPGGVA